jgi:hypothetical protein
MTKWTTVAAALLLSLASAGASAQGYREGIDDTPSAAAMVFDFAIVRPLGIVSTVAGLGLFVVTLPFTAPQGDAGAAAQRLVVDPAHFTFVRPLGEVP